MRCFDGFLEDSGYSLATLEKDQTPSSQWDVPQIKANLLVENDFDAP
ncbi:MULTISPECIES: hypothetical protein [unclassified Thiocapsa]